MNVFYYLYFPCNILSKLSLDAIFCHATSQGLEKGQ